MAIFTLSPLNGFYGMLGSISVQLAFLLITLIFVRPTEVAFAGGTQNWTDDNLAAYTEQVNFRRYSIGAHVWIFVTMALSQWLSKRWRALVTVMITLAMFAQIYLVIFALDVIIQSVPFA